MTFLWGMIATCGVWNLQPSSLLPLQIILTITDSTMTLIVGLIQRALKNQMGTLVLKISVKFLKAHSETTGGLPQPGTLKGVTNQNANFVTTWAIQLSLTHNFIDQK